MNLRLIGTWILGAIGIWLVQLNYQAAEWVALMATSMMVALAVLLSWSAFRVNVTTSSGLLKLLMMSVVAGLMMSQALDVVYQSAALPAGNRFGFFLEVVFLAAQVLPFAYLGGRFWPWAKPKVNRNSSNGQQQPEQPVDPAR